MHREIPAPLETYPLDREMRARFKPPGVADGDDPAGPALAWAKELLLAMESRDDRWPLWMAEAAYEHTLELLAAERFRRVQAVAVANAAFLPPEARAEANEGAVKAARGCEMLEARAAFLLMLHDYFRTSQIVGGARGIAAAIAARRPKPAKPEGKK